MLCRRAIIIEMLIALFQLICVVDGELAVAPQLGLGDGELTVFTGGGLVVDNRDTIIGTDRHLHTADGHRTSLAVHVHHQLARVGLAIGLMHQTIFVDQQIRLTVALINGGRDSRYRHRVCGRIAIGIRHRDVERIVIVLAISDVLSGSCVDDLVATFSSAFDLQVVVLISSSIKNVFFTITISHCKGVALPPDCDGDRGRLFPVFRRKIVRTNGELFQRDLDGLRSILDRFRITDSQHRRIIQGIGRNRTGLRSPLRRDSHRELIRQVGVAPPGHIIRATIHRCIESIGVIDSDCTITLSY